MITEANVADLERTCLGFCWACPDSSALPKTSVFDDDASSPFLAALPRTSSAKTAAGSFFDLSSSDDLDDVENPEAPSVSQAEESDS